MLQHTRQLLFTKPHSETHTHDAAWGGVVAIGAVGGSQGPFEADIQL